MLSPYNYNIHNIYESPNSIFVADKLGQLETISRFNFLGRIVEWFRDVLSGGERSQRTDRVIADTLNTILKNLKSNAPRSYYFQESFCPPPYARYRRPMNEVANKILNSPLSKKPEVSRLAQQIKEVSLPIIEDLSAQKRKDLFDAPWNF